MVRTLPRFFFASLVVLVSSAAVAANIPILPFSQTPFARPSSGTVTAMGDVNQPSPLTPIQPCRVVDTRLANGAWGGPKLVGGASRSFDLNSNPACTGMPQDIFAFAVNLTVTASEADNGFLKAYPTGSTQPVVANLNFNTNDTRGNFAIVPANSAGSIDIFTNVNTHLIIDVYGYFTNGDNSGSPWNSGQHMWINGDNASELFFVWNHNNTSASPFNTSLGGYRDSTIDTVVAVYGEMTGATGVTSAIRGRNSSASNGATGVHGEAMATTGIVYGARGKTNSLSGEAAGVLGIAGTAAWAQSANCGGCTNGVRGIGDGGGYNIGVDGEGTNNGVLGQRVTTAGGQVTYGALGWDTTTGVYTPNNISAANLKSFVEPHPLEAGKVIRYVSLEGPEPGTFYRGKGKFHGRTASIQVPDYFRLVTSDEGLSIQVTPIGEIASVAVVTIDLNQIELKSNRDVEFFYTVQGTRKAFPDFNPVEEDKSFFIPRSATDRVDTKVFNAELRSRLIQTGVYNEDGSVNMSTAERMGWAQEWRQAEKERAAWAAAHQAQTENPGPQGHDSNPQGH